MKGDTASERSDIVTSCSTFAGSLGGYSQLAKILGKPTDLSMGKNIQNAVELVHKEIFLHLLFYMKGWANTRGVIRCTSVRGYPFSY